MDKKFTPLEFEKSIYQIEDKIEELKNLSSETGISLDDQIKVLTEQADEFKKQLYSHLSPSQKLQIARTSYASFLYGLCFHDKHRWTELHGDRAGTDDRAIIGGVAQIDGNQLCLSVRKKVKQLKKT